MDHENTIENEPAQRVRAPYVRPELRAYGAVSRLTSGGSGAFTEAQAMDITELMARP